MALSSSWDFSVTAADVIQSALEKIKAVIAGESVDSDDQALALRELNKLVKQWSNPSDNSPGMKVWLRKIIYLFQAYGTREYSIGPSTAGGDKCVTAYSSTTIRAAEAASQTVLDVVSTTGMTAGDVIGVKLDDGTLFWSTINTTGAGPTVTLNAAITAAASAGNAVFWYTASSALVQFRILEVLTALLRDLNTVDTPVGVFSRMELPDFEGITDKTNKADAIALFVEPQRLLTKITLDHPSNDVSKVIRMIAIQPADDLDSVTNDLQFPPEWYSALEWELAKRLSTPFAYNWTQLDESNWQQATGIARQINPRGFEGGFHSEDGCEDEGTL